MTGCIIFYPSTKREDLYGGIFWLHFSQTLYTVEGGDNVSLYEIDLKRMLLLPNCSQPYSEKLILNAWGAVNEETQSWLKK